MNGAVFLSGIATATFAASGLFFLKFWRASHDRFFLFFGAACEVLALERVVSLFFNPINYQGTQPIITEAAVYVYLFRLIAFLMILIGIWEKNRPARRH